MFAEPTEPSHGNLFRARLAESKLELRAEWGGRGRSGAKDAVFGGSAGFVLGSGGRGNRAAP